MLPHRLGRLPRHRPLGDRLILEARGPRARLLGLALLDDLPRNAALLIPRCRSVHTFGMRFALDVVFIDRDCDPIHVELDVPPRRVVGHRHARAVLETRAGEADAFLSLLPRAGEAGTSAPTTPAPPSR